MPSLTLAILGQRVGVGFDEPAVGSLLEIAYGRLATVEPPGDLRFEIAATASGRKGNRTRSVRWGRGKGFRAADDGELLVALDAALTIELQRRRPDLFFVHAAVLERHGRAIMLAGRPGSGKSTTCWGLLQNGFRYLSDELGPTEVASGRVHPYSRALVLKREPPPPFGAPAEALRTGRTLHVPIAPGRLAPALPPPRLAVIVFLDYRSSGGQASLRPIGDARASAQLYTHALNALAHAGEGLEAAVEIAGKATCFELVSPDLATSCRLIGEATDELLAP